MPPPGERHPSERTAGGDRARCVAVALAAGTVAAISELPRILVTLDALPRSLWWLGWSDLLATYVDRGLAGGHWPYFDVPFEYPPLIGYPAGLFAAITSSAAGYLMWWAVVIVLATAATAYLLARASGPKRAFWRFALAPQLLVYAGMNMDVLPAGLTVAAVVAAQRGRPIAAMVGLGIGATAKLFPALVAPALLFRAGRRAWRLAAVLLATITLVFLPSLFTSHPSTSGVAYYATGYEAGGIAVWGLVRYAMDGLGVPNAAGIVLVLTTAGLVATYVFGIIPRSRHTADPAVGMCLTVIAILFWSRLFSPQFSLWILPFFALVPAIGRGSIALLAVADMIVFVGVSQLTLVQRDPTDAATTVLIAILTVAAILRHVALIHMWREVSASSDLSDRLSRERRFQKHRVAATVADVELRADPSDVHAQRLG